MLLNFKENNPKIPTTMVEAVAWSAKHSKSQKLLL